MHMGVDAQISLYSLENFKGDSISYEGPINIECMDW
jgi:hypothetical protein